MSSPQGNLLLTAIKDYINKLKESSTLTINHTKRDAKKDVMKNLVSFNFDLKTNLVQSYIRDIEEALKKSNMCFITLTFKTLRKFISGWSAIYFITEAPLAWDLILDIPYIPGSSIKGIVRDYFDELTGNSELTSYIFGDKNEVGKVLFFDAYPTSGNNILTYDIINPHYKNVDNEYEVTPLPVKFLVINKGVEFTTFIAFDKEDLEKYDKDALSMLLKAIILSMKTGWGRRTTRGYGDLEIVSKEVEMSCPSS